MPASRITAIAAILAFALCGLATGTALAGDGARVWEIQWNVGYTEFDRDIGDAGFRTTIRGGYHFTKIFELNAEIGGSFDVEAAGTKAPLYTGFLNAVFNFPGSNGRAVPYFLVGGGWAAVDLGTFDDSGVAYQAAVGGSFYGEQRRVGLRLELGAMGADLFNQTTLNWNITGGFTSRIGGR